MSASESVVQHPIFIGDPGFMSEEVTQLLDDYDRVDYYKSHMNELLKGTKLLHYSIKGAFKPSFHF